MHKWRPIYYSFVYVLIRLSCSKATFLLYFVRANEASGSNKRRQTLLFNRQQKIVLVQMHIPRRGHGCHIKFNL